MKDSYSLDADSEGLDRQYRTHYRAYFNIFNRCHLPTIAVQSDVGMMGGEMAHEYMYLAPIGEDTWCCAMPVATPPIDRWPRCTNQHQPLSSPAQWKKSRLPGRRRSTHSPHISRSTSDRQGGIFFVAAIADTSDEDTVQQRFVFAVVRGDGAQRNQTGQCSQSTRLRPAHEDEIRHWGRARLCLAIDLTRPRPHCRR